MSTDGAISERVARRRASRADRFTLQPLERRLLLSGDAVGVELLSQWGGPVLDVVASGQHAFTGIGPKLKVFDTTNTSTLLEVGSLLLPQPVSSLAANGDRVYVADARQNLRIIDVSDPAEPKLLNSFTFNPRLTMRAVAASGSLVYLAAGGGLWILDASDPSSITPLGSVDTVGSAQGVTVSGSRAYISDFTAGLQIIDVSDPTAPVLLGGYNSSGFARDVAVQGSLAYLADDHAGVHILDVSNPAAPVRLGGYNTPGWAVSIQVSGSLAYVADRFHGMHVLNVSNPAAPIRLGGFDTEGDAWAIAVTGTQAYVADRFGGLLYLDVSNPHAPWPLAKHDASDWTRDLAVSEDRVYLLDGLHFYVLDVSDPSTPVQVSRTPLFADPFSGGAWHIAVSGSFVYIGAGASGLMIYDVSNPAAPVPITTYTQVADARDVAVVGTRVFVTADSFGGQNGGLYVLDVSDPSAPVGIGHFQHTDMLGTLGSGPIAVSGSIAYVGGRGVFALDVTNPQPSLLGRYIVSETPVTLAISESALYLGGNGGLTMLDVSNPQSMQPLGHYPAAVIGAVAVAGPLVIAGDWDNGVEVLDFSNPAAPVRIGGSRPAGVPWDIAVSDSLIWTASFDGGFAALEWEDIGPPTLEEAVFDFDRRPHELRFSFSEGVFSSLSLSDIQVDNLTTGQPVPASVIALNYDSLTNVATVTFPGYLNSILPDARYRATMNAADVTDIFDNPLTEDVQLDFLFLMADANNDGGVNLADFNILASNFGGTNKTFSQGDFNYDRIVNLADFNILAGRFGAVLSAGFLLGRSASSLGDTAPADERSSEELFASL